LWIDRLTEWAVDLRIDAFVVWPPDPGTTTIARLLKGAGYSTACVGKWGLGIANLFGRQPGHNAAPAPPIIDFQGPARM